MRSRLAKRSPTYLPFLFANPQLVERAQASEDAATEPAAVPSLSRVARRVDFDVREVAHELVVEALSEACEQTPASGEHDVAHEYLAHVRVARGERLRD